MVPIITGCDEEGNGPAFWVEHLADDGDEGDVIMKIPKNSK